MTKKKEKSYAQKLIPVIIMAVLVYTVAAFILQFYTSVEISPTLTTLYFGFWTVELINLTMIKTSKEKTKREGHSLEMNDSCCDEFVENEFVE